MRKIAIFKLYIRSIELVEDSERAEYEISPNNYPAFSLLIGSEFQNFTSNLVVAREIKYLMLYPGSLCRKEDYSSEC